MNASRTPSINCNPSPSPFSHHHVRVLETFTHIKYRYISSMFEVPLEPHLLPISVSSLRSESLDELTLARLILVYQGGQPECAPTHPICSWWNPTADSIQARCHYTMERPLQISTFGYPDASARTSEAHIPISNIWAVVYERNLKAAHYRIFVKWTWL